MRDQEVAEIVRYFDQEKYYGRWDRISAADMAVIEMQVEKVQEDIEFYFRNFCWISRKNGEAILFELWGAQRLLLDKLKEMKARGLPRKLFIIKGRQMGYCLDPETKILTADMRWIRLGDVEVGQELVGTDEDTLEGKTDRKKSRKMRRSVVEAKREIKAMAFRLEMSNGEILTATLGHRFLCWRKNASWHTWTEVKDLRPGDRIRLITKPWGMADTAQAAMEDGWAGGLMDGEGSMSSEPEKNGCSLRISQVDGPVFRRIQNYIESRGYTNRTEVDKREPGKSSKLGSKEVWKVCVDRIDQVMRLVGKTRPERFVNAKWWEGRSLPKQGDGAGWPEIVSIEPLGIRTMIDLQTSTKTFVANGFVSHNSTLVDHIIGWSTMFFSGINGLIVSKTPSHASFLFQTSVLHAFSHLPWWMKPMRASTEIREKIVFDNPNLDERDRNFGLNSQVIVQSATMKTGVGEGMRVNCAHMSEMSEWDQNSARAIIKGDLGFSFPDDPGTLAIIETTGKFAGNWTHEFWLSCQEKGDESEWKCFFAPAFLEQDRRKVPVQGWTPPEEERAIAERIAADWLRCDNQLCDRGYDVIGGYLIAQQCPGCGVGTLKPYILTDEQLCFFWSKRINSEDSEESYKEFKQQLCLSVEDAFQLTGSPAFPTNIMDFVNRSIRTPIATGLFDSVGRFHYPDITKGQSCSHAWCIEKHQGQERNTQVWEWPDKTAQYFIFADVASGDGGKKDYSVAWVMRVGKGEAADRQVAMFRSNTISSVEFGYLLNKLGRMYNTCPIAPETNVYEAACTTLRIQCGYPNVWRPLGITNKWGWRTSEASKKAMWDKFRFRLWNKQVIIRSFNFFNEMKNFRVEHDPETLNKTVGSGSKHKHDDEIISAMGAVCCAHQFDVSGSGDIKAALPDGSADAQYRFRMICKKCGNVWGADDPNKEVLNGGCPSCKSIWIVGKYQGLKQGLVPGVKFYEEEYEGRETVEMRYDAL